ncbi:MAG: DinB family protein, partial [Ginsengibacter sp.]
MKKGTIISKISKKEQGNFPQNFKNYFQEAGDDDLLTALSQQQIEIEKLGQNVNEEKSLFAYAEDKWTLREVLQHLIDAERVFAYRALAFARKDANILPSFDENDYARYSYATDRAWSSLIAEFLAVRKST